MWKRQGASRRSKRGRAMGRMLMGIKKKLVVGGEEGRVRMEGIIMERVRCEKGMIRVVGMYMNGDMEKKLERLREWMEIKKKRVRTLLGDGGFNARTRRGK